MNICEFAENVKQQLYMELGNDYILEIVEVVAKNDEKKHAIRMRKKGISITSRIYIDDYFEMFENYQICISQIVSEMLEVFTSFNIEIDEKKYDYLIYDYEKVSEYIYMDVVNAERNKDFLCDYPHVQVLDLAIYFYVFTDNEMMHVSNLVLKEWNISIEELYERSLVNTQKKYPYLVENMFDFIFDKIEGIEFTEIDKHSMRPIYILSNETRMDGCKSMFYKDLLEDFATAAGADLVIMPSSRDEVLLVKYESDMDAEFFKSMVRGANSECVEDSLFLSNNVYYYSRERKRLEFFENK